MELYNEIDKLERKLNRYQTPIDQELIDKIPREVYLDLITYITEVPFIASLISPDMPRVIDLPKYKDGRVKVNIVEPHALENIDYFREAAIAFNETGKYTTLTPNPHPKSPYKLFWKEEARRCLFGMTRDDGEWIPGDLYWYWNYCPMMIVEQIAGSKRGKRVLRLPRPWLGDYLFFHYKEQAEYLGQHVGVIKQRGVGWSYKGASFGSKRSVLMTKQDTFYTAYEKEFLNKGAVLNKAWDNLDFIAQNTPWPGGLRLVDSLNKMEVRLGYKDLDDGTKKGSLGGILGVSSKDDKDRIRGKRGTIFFEEFGKFPGVNDVWNICRDSVEDGDIAFDTLIAGGTGGTEGADFSGAEDMIYNPQTYNIMGLPNVFDKNPGTGKVIFHWGAYLNRNLCYDENGMPDVIKALVEVLTEFDTIRKSSSDSKALTQRRAEKCITIQDAIMRTEGTVFPVVDLKDYLETLHPRLKQMTDSHYIGNLILNSKGVEWKPDRNKLPIRAFPFKPETAEQKEGAVEIFEMPKKNSNGTIDSMRYIAGIDPVDDDEAPYSVSLPSIFILDLFTDRIVAEYTGRPKYVDDWYETARRLLILYNAQANYEMNKKGLYAYFSNRNSLHLLVDVPEILSDKNMGSQKGYGNKSKGVNANPRINDWARRLITQWLIEPATTQEYNEDGEQIGEKLNMHTIRSVAFIQEMIKWNKDMNADRVSAMGMLMILRQDRLKYIETAKVEDEGISGDELAGDDYFDTSNQSSTSSLDSYGINWNN